MRNLIRSSIRIAMSVGLLVVLVAGCSSKDSVRPPEPVRYGAVTGYVFLHGTEIPLSKAVVTVDDRSDTTLTSGRYFIDSIPRGVHTLTVTRDEYRDYAQSITVSDTGWLDISLRIDIDVGDLHGYVTHPIYGPVSSATVVVGDDSVYTNLDGYYKLPNVPVGEQTLRCSKSSEGYHDYVSEVYITGSDNVFNMVMIRTVHDSVRVTKDTYVEHNSRSPDANSMNFGAIGEVAMMYWIDLDSTVIRRALIGLPNLPSQVSISDLDSVTLVLRDTPDKNISTGVSWVPQTIVARRLMQEWGEQDVTGNTEPRSDTAVYSIFKSSEKGLTLLDLMGIYTHPEKPNYGLRLAFQEDDLGTGGGVRRLEFYSREAYSPPYYRGPLVVFVYTH